jgi:peroxiredoxin
MPPNAIGTGKRRACCAKKADRVARSHKPTASPLDPTSAAHLIAGTRLPDVALPATSGADVNLSRFQERAVVFVYPMTGTPGQANPPGWDDIPGAHGSTPEAEGFRDAYQDFQNFGYEIFGVSGQASPAQREFVGRAGIPYLLLSDAEYKFADALELPRFQAGNTTFLRRLTLIVYNATIYRTIYPVEAPAGHAQALIKDLAQARV